MESNFFWVGLGLALLGYFIGNGLRHFGQPKNSPSTLPPLVKKADLPYYLGLTKQETEDLLNQHPEIKELELNGTIFYSAESLRKELLH